MKAVFISYNQAHTQQVDFLLDRYQIRGFTRWSSVAGRGSNTGEPHYGSHAWPGMNTAVLAIMDEEKVTPLLDALRKLDRSAEQQGLRAFVWNVEEMM
jgi:nitrogen regulatory protein PII